MGIVGRFTRDEVSAKVWWPLAMLLLVVLVLTFPGQNRAMQDDRAAYAAVQDDPRVPEFSDSQITEQARWVWLGYRITAGAGFAITFLLALLSMREPKARIGAGVKFYPESVPPYLAVIDADEAEQLRELGTYARRRVGDLQGRIASMESEQLALEGEVQRLLSAAAAKGATRVIAAPDLTSGVVVVPEAAASHDVVELPATSSPVADEPAAANAGAPPADETPADMLARMVEPAGGVDVSDAARVDLRARLERTAALKKPGSKERREERERIENDESETRLP